MRVAIYARVSSEDQAERGTIENQLEFARKYCDLHQLNIVDWYKDDGISGTVVLEDRTEGKRLLEDAKNGKIDMILIYKLDRLGRTARIILNAVHELEQDNVKVRSMTEPFDTGDPSGRFLLTILAGVADLERETILDRLWHGANRAARQGKWLGGIVPYGYFVNDEKFLEINENPIPGKDMSEADVVRLIFHLIADEEMSTIKAADYLNALAIPPSYTIHNRKIKKGKRKENTASVWRPNAVLRIVRNKTYMGIHEYGKRSKKEREIIEREVPAIVTLETWEKALEVLKENQIESFRNTKRTKYLLRSLIKCGACGLNYIGMSYKNNLAYYVCNGKHAYRGPLEGKCKSKNVPKRWLEDLVWNDCLDFIMNPGEALSQLQGKITDRKSQKVTIEQEIDSILKSVKDKELEKQSILDLFRKNLITTSDVEAQLHKITLEKDYLSTRINDLKSQLLTEGNMLDSFDSAEIFLNQLREKLDGEITFEVKREIVKSLVKRITVFTTQDHKGKERYNASIEFNFHVSYIKVADHTDMDLKL